MSDEETSDEETSVEVRPEFPDGAPVHLLNGKTHEVRVVDLVPVDKYRVVAAADPNGAYFFKPFPVQEVFDDKIITTWYVNQSAAGRNPIGTRGTLRSPYWEVANKARRNQIEQWAHTHRDEYYAHSDYSAEAVAAREQELVQQQQAQQQADRAQQAAIDQAVENAQRQAQQQVQAQQAEIDRLREQLREREGRIEELNQLVGRRDAHVEHLEGQLQARLQARPAGHGGYQPDEDDEAGDKDDDGGGWRAAYGVKGKEVSVQAGDGAIGGDFGGDIGGNHATAEEVAFALECMQRDLEQQFDRLCNEVKKKSNAEEVDSAMKELHNYVKKLDKEVSTKLCLVGLRVDKIAEGEKISKQKEEMIDMMGKMETMSVPGINDSDE